MKSQFYFDMTFEKSINLKHLLMCKTRINLKSQEINYI